MNRRAFIYALALSATGGAWAWQRFHVAEQAEEAVLRLRGSDGVRRLSGRPLTFITAPDDLYVTAIGQPPAFEPATFRLRIEGRVKRPVELSLDDLRRAESVQRTRTLECIGNKPGGRSIGNAEWTGATLRHLLERASPLDDAVEVVLHCLDGYSESMPLADAMSGETMIAWEVDGAPLPPDHGAPLRVIYPGRFGMKNPKFVSRIEVVSAPVDGYWESRGWSKEARVLLTSGFRWPGPGATGVPAEPLLLHGYAYGGDNAVAAVEVSVDGGGSWRIARLIGKPERYVWTLWELPWTPPGPGARTLVVRAIDAAGRRQDERVSASASAGNTGLHRVQVTVS